MTQQDPIKPAQEQSAHDLDAQQRFLFDIRCGGEPEILHDPDTGWELHMYNHDGFYPLEGSEGAVNMILSALAHHYRRVSAVLGDPDQVPDDAVLQKLSRANDALPVEPTKPMTDDLALRAVEAAQRTINEYVDLGFVTDVVRDEGGYLGFSYDPERFARMTAESSADAA